MSKSPHHLHAILGPGNYRRLATSTGLSWSHLSKILRGKHGTKIETLDLIAKSAGVSTGELQAYIAWSKQQNNTTNGHQHINGDNHPTLGVGNFNRIARASGYTRQHVSRVLRGRNGMTVKCMDAIANAADVDVDTLLEHIKSYTSETLA